MTAVGWGADVSYDDVARLRDQAADAGDDQLRLLCRVALGVDPGDVAGAQAAVAKIIREAR